MLVGWSTSGTAEAPWASRRDPSGLRRPGFSHGWQRGIQGSSSGGDIRTYKDDTGGATELAKRTFSNSSWQ